jgi:hypothetical protein
MALRNSRAASIRRFVWLLSGFASLVPAAALPQPAPVPFVDVSRATGLDFVYFNGMVGELYFVEMMGGGAALLDYDGDGDLDVYLVQGDLLGDDTLEEALIPVPAPLPLTDRLLRNDGSLDAGGRHQPVFADLTATAGLPAGGYGLGVASADIDNDGFPDLYVSNFGPNRLLRNRGDGSFADITASSGTGEAAWSAAASFFDYDRDGLLDLYVGNYVDYRWETREPCYSETGVLDYCGPGAFSGVADRLFHNRGAGVFEDVSRRSGIGLVAGKTLGTVAADFDGDGRADVYAANDGEPNFLWLNQGDGTFSDGALLSGTGVSLEGMPQASMGVGFGDLDGDGLDDLFLSHLTSETNTLYRNEGGGLYTDVSYETGVGLPSWPYTGFGVGLLDYDNDTDLDLFVANGAVRVLPELRRRGDPYPLRQPDQLFRNDGRGRFTDVSSEAGAALAPHEVGRGVAVGDVDNDGDPDLLVIDSAAPARLLRNEAGGANGWLGLVPRGGAGETALGSRAMVVTSEGDRIWRRSATDGSYASASDGRILWGLGPTARVTELEVRWANGAVSRWHDIDPRAYLVIEQPSRR